MNLSEIAISNGIETELHFNEIPSDVTVKDWFRFWFQSYKRESIRSVTKRKYYTDFAHICISELKNMRMVDVNRAIAQKYMNNYGETRSKLTFYDHWQRMRSLYNDAMIDGVVKTNPFKNITPKFKEQKLNIKELKELRDRKEWLEADEYNKFTYKVMFWLEENLNSNKDKSIVMFYMLILILIKTGARFSEVLGITKDDILWDSNELYINKSFDYKEKNDFDMTKNIMSVRKIVVDESTMKLLTKYLDWIERNKVETEKGALFIEKDIPIYNSTVNNRLNKLFRSLDIEPITVHKLRHSHASLLLSNNIPLTVIAKRLGHSDTTMITRVYGHLLKQVEENGNNKILGLI